MITEVYILGESPTRDGLNLDYFCKDKTSLTELVRKTFLERFDPDEEITINSIKTNDIGDIVVNYSHANEERIFTQYYYVRKAVK